MIRRLAEPDAPAYSALRREMLLDSPLAFASAPGDDVASSVEGIRQRLRPSAHAAIYGAFAPDLVGAAGLYRDPHVKAAHKAHLWGMYVAPAHRGKGLASALLEALLGHARTWSGVTWVHLGVTEAAPAARRLYERAGFREWGREPDALRFEGRSVGQAHMALRLG